MKIQRGFKFRLKPLSKQATQQCWQQAGACRFVWNVFFKRQEYRRTRGHYVESFQAMCLALTQLKKHHTWLKDIDSTILQQTLKDLYRAYQDGFDKKQTNKRLPKLKKKYKSRPAFRYTQRVEIHHGNRVYLPKIGEVGFYKSRDIIGKIKNTTVGYDNGHWHVSFQTDYERTERPHQSNTMVGVDLGVKRLATLSSGYYVQGIDALRKQQGKLAKWQRRLAKKKRSSANWRKIKAKISTLHSTIARCRKDLLHKFSHYLSKNHAVIVFEDLKVKNMSKSAKGSLEAPGKQVAQKSGLNKAILDQGWSMLMDFCRYKQDWKNGELIKINPKGTSQRCCVCTHTEQANRQTQSDFHCLACGHTMNADDNASMNILAAGHAVLACGAPALASALKQESLGFAKSRLLLIN
jgi:putative transposase